MGEYFANEIVQSCGKGYMKLRYQNGLKLPTFSYSEYIESVGCNATLVCLYFGMYGGVLWAIV